MRAALIAVALVVALLAFPPIWAGPGASSTEMYRMRYVAAGLGVDAEVFAFGEPTPNYATLITITSRHDARSLWALAEERMGGYAGMGLCAKLPDGNEACDGARYSGHSYGVCELFPPTEENGPCPYAVYPAGTVFSVNVWSLTVSTTGLPEVGTTGTLTVMIGG